MAFFIKEFDADSTEYTDTIEQFGLWTKEHIGEFQYECYTHKDPIHDQMNVLFLEYTKIRKSVWGHHETLSSVYRHSHANWQLYQAYSRLANRVEVLFNFDDEYMALQCKLAIL